MARYSKKQIAESREALRELFAIGATVDVKLVSVARSGMSRRLRFYVDRSEPGKSILEDVTEDVAVLLGCSTNDKGMKIDGCGMDMGFAAVSDLGYALFTEAECKGKTHNNSRGYALKHNWLN